MMLLSTAHLILSFVRAVQAFNTPSDSISATPNAYYSNFASPLQTVKSCVFIAQTLLGDGVMIWRCYVVFNNNKFVLILSLIPLIINLIFGVLGAKNYVQHEGDLLRQTSGFYFSTFIAMTLAVNLSCSAAVVYRIYRSSKELQAFNKVFPLVSAIIQSGAFYATGILAVLISYTVKSTGVYPAIDIVVPLVGIVFSLIVLQIHFHLSAQSRNNLNVDEQTSNLATLGTLPRWRHYFSTTTELHQQQQGGGMPDARCQLQRCSTYSREDMDIVDQASLSSDSDTRIKEASRVPRS
ncbi:hypothetical protein AN958_07121 [Leucoagaricus sp. SymC.cos]|nr:hypothetical protein AN958_07121 [Leucoagaricus sp. SymC.cos]